MDPGSRRPTVPPSTRLVGGTLGAPVRTRHGDAAWEIPEEWESLRRGGPGPFVTWELARRPDGRVVEFSSRRQRKGLGPRPVAAADGHRPGGGTPARRARRRAVRWAPRLLGWWIAVLFMIGSACFAAGAPGGRPGRRLLAWQPGRIDWWACAIQLAGTVWFNINTFDALRVGLTTRQQNLRIWTPDMIGSACFLVASWLALAEVCHRR